MVRGTAAPRHVSGFAYLDSISCRSATACSAGGQFSGAHGATAFVVNMTSGIWGKARQVAGEAALRGHSEGTSISCASVGHCLARGGGELPPGFVARETNGGWGESTAIPRLTE